MSKDHFDEISYRCVEAVIRVHTLADYERLKRIEKEDYFWRFQYTASTGGFDPKRVPVYCSCGEPYNPDLSMVECDICGEWYHTTCAKLSETDLENLETFNCDNCMDQVLGKNPSLFDQSPAPKSARKS